MWLPAKVAEAHPRPHPQGGAERVEHQETPPPHAADTGDESVDLPEYLDEARDRDDPAAVPFEEGLGLVQPLLGKAHIATAEMPDGEADVVAGDSRYEAYDANRHDVEPTRARVDRGGDEDGLAGNGNSEVLDQDE